MKYIVKSTSGDKIGYTGVYTLLVTSPVYVNPMPYEEALEIINKHPRVKWAPLKETPEGFYLSRIYSLEAIELNEQELLDFIKHNGEVIIYTTNSEYDCDHLFTLEIYDDYRE